MTEHQEAQVRAALELAELALESCTTELQGTRLAAQEYDGRARDRALDAVVAARKALANPTGAPLATCPSCRAVGFAPSEILTGACEFCDGTAGPLRVRTLREDAYTPPQLQLQLQP